ncbi:Pectin lyase-like superfamily protein [Zea mays]|uniref:Pectin lyase-like superfamily protein n=1 Tax=Zea mays TaxID=4577 RepID=A0A1D6LRI2_MAIZE|nr:Pectin lyase-like superfamily protein [Zea mays]
MDFVNNGEVSGVTLLNSNFFHMNMYRRKDMLIKDVTVMAPGDSPNTDGIHMGDSSGTRRTSRTSTSRIPLLRRRYSTSASRRTRTPPPFSPSPRSTTRISRWRTQPTPSSST